MGWIYLYSIVCGCTPSLTRYLSRWYSTTNIPVSFDFHNIHKPFLDFVLIFHNVHKRRFDMMVIEHHGLWFFVYSLRFSSLATTVSLPLLLCLGFHCLLSFLSKVRMDNFWHSMSFHAAKGEGIMILWKWRF